jgi:hypothetical protein
MSDVTVKVLNEEYERVLSNPDNVIISDDLQDLLDIDMPVTTGRSTSTNGVDTIVMSLLDADDGLPISVRGQLGMLKHSDDTYTLAITTSNVKKAFLKGLSTLKVPGLLTVEGEYSLEIEDCQVISWILESSAPADLSLAVKFRSENGIF